jgi:hypothetical protein
MKSLKTLAVILTLMMTSAWAGSDDGYKQFTGGKRITVEPDKAYLLYRDVVHDSIWTMPFGRAFVRLLSPEELKAAFARRDKDGQFTEEPNVVMVMGGDAYAKAGEEWTYLVAVKPGDYLLIGPQVNGGQPTCLCLGSVMVKAAPGVITDLGYIYFQPYKRWSATPRRGEHQIIGVKPYADGMPVPGTLVNLPRASGDWRAVADFPNYFRGFVDRIDPVPGVLDYDDDGRMIDLKTTRAN